VTSLARDSFLSGIRAFVAACDLQPVRAHDDVGLLLRRGMTVAAYNLLETFLDDRLLELATHVNGGSTQFLDLPERLQKRSISQTLAVAAVRLRRSALDIADLRAYSQSVGTSLSAVGSALALSPLMWAWTGSNLSSDDVSTMLKSFQVESPWNAALGLAGRLGFQTVDLNRDAIDLKEDLDALATERHKSAHVASHSITSLWLRAVPDRLSRIAVSVDVMASAGAHLLRVGDAAMLAGQSFDPASRLRFRFVRERSRDFAETLEGKTKAYRVSPDGDQLYAAARSRCADLEVAVRQGPASDVRNWSMPCVS
jgi:hypothetical protein